MRGGTDPRHLVEGQTDVVAVGQGRLAGMDTSAHADPAIGGPLVLV